MKKKEDFEKDFIKMMNNPVFGKTMESIKLVRDIKLVKPEKSRKYFVSEASYNANFFQNPNSNRNENKKPDFLE